MSDATAEAGRADEGATLSPDAVMPEATARVLFLIPRDPKAAIIEELDRRLDAPHSAPLPKGKLQLFQDWDGDDKAAYRYVTEAGAALVARIPAWCCTPDIEEMVAQMAALMERYEAERRVRPSPPFTDATTPLL